MAFHHVPVLLDEVVQALEPRPDGTYVDCTVGGAGHSWALAERLGPQGRLVAFDRDATAVEVARARLAGVPPRVDVVHAPFSRLGEALAELGLSPGSVDGVLADLGVSSHQIDTAERGFSFQQDGPLDMRMDTSSGPSAADLVASLPEADLADLIYRLGDERRSRAIARAIVGGRTEARLLRTGQLAELVQDAVGGRKGARVHPATRTFQALRMAVNGELDELSALLGQALRWLRVGGRLAVISFHSGEDRPVKRLFHELASPPADPADPYGRRPAPLVRLPWRRGLVGGAEEIEANPRARSARLRVAEKLREVDP